MAEMTNLRDLLVDELRDIYHAEKQITKALPKMIRAATSDDLKAGFEKHLEETHGQIERLSARRALSSCACAGPGIAASTSTRA